MGILAENSDKKDVIEWLKSRFDFKVDWTQKAEQKKIFNAAKKGEFENLKKYIFDGGPVDCTPYGSQTPLYIAAFYGKSDCVEYLLQQGANKNKTEKDGYTPAHAAASQGHLGPLQ